MNSDLTIYINSVSNKELFFCNLVEFYTNIEKQIVIDVWFKNRKSVNKKIQHYSFNNWIRKVFFKQYSFKVTIENYQLIIGLLKKEIKDNSWGIAKNNNKAIVFIEYNYDCIYINNYNSKDYENILNLLKEMEHKDIIKIT